MRRVWIHWRKENTGEVSLIADDRLCRLNRVAAAVWQDIEDLPDLETLVRRIRRRFRGVTERALRKDLDALLQDWLRNGWIVPCEDPVFLFAEEPLEKGKPQG